MLYPLSYEGKMGADLRLCVVKFSQLDAVKRSVHPVLLSIVTVSMVMGRSTPRQGLPLTRTNAIRLSTAGVRLDRSRCPEPLLHPEARTQS